MLNYNKIYLILATAAAIGLWLEFLPKIFIAIPGCALIILSIYGWMIKNKVSAAEAVFSLLIIIVITGSIFFYFFSLGKLAIIACLIVIFWKTRDAEIKFPNFQISQFFNFLAACYLLLAAALFYLLAASASDNSIASPWLILPKYFLLLFFAATALLIYIPAKKCSPIFIAIHFFLFFSAAAFVYKIGYGFDIFNHEAAINYISAHGTITPKPFQYVGFYSIAVFLNRVTAIPPEFFLKFFLPVAAAALIPAFAMRAFKNSAVPILSLLLLPLPYFIVSTPQGAANLFLFLIILGNTNILSGAISTLLIHPITGIVSAAYFAFLNYRKKRIVVICGALAIPLAFAFFSYKLSGRVIVGFRIFETLRAYTELLTLGGLKTNYNFWLDIFYLIKFSLLPIIITVSGWAAWRFRKNIGLAPLAGFAISQIGFILMSAMVDFSYLISYEQKNYPERLFYISFLFLAPYFVFAAQKIYEKLTSPPYQGGGSIIKIFFTGLFAFAITANFYMTYPRWDNYENDKGKNVTATMLHAVELIEKNATGRNYVVLSDQTTAAAALKLYGFKKYYKTPLGEVFYYPIPTAGPLYNEFLNLIYNDAGAKSAENAKILTGAEAVYIALPSYWDNYDKIKENLKTEMRVIFEDKNIVILK